MRLVLFALFAAGLAQAGSIYIAATGVDTNGIGLASASAFVHPGSPAPRITDIARVSFAVELTVIHSELAGPGSGKFQACFVLLIRHNRLLRFGDSVIRNWLIWWKQRCE